MKCKCDKFFASKGYHDNGCDLVKTAPESEDDLVLPVKDRQDIYDRLMRRGWGPKAIYRIVEILVNIRLGHLDIHTEIVPGRLPDTYQDLIYRLRLQKYLPTHGNNRKLGVA